MSTDVASPAIRARRPEGDHVPRGAAALAAAAPASRDRYVDLLRVSSLAVVVVGHWLMAVVVIGRGGAVEATNVLALLPWLQPATWLLQVMPVFFFVGGFSHATAIESIRRRGGGYVDFARSRSARLLRPTAAFVAVWLAAALAFEISGRDHGVLRLATQTVAQPLWFVGVYLGVIALAPPMLRLHEYLQRRSPGRPWGVVAPAGLAVGAALVDIARFAGGVPYIGFVNVALVWLAVHQLGYLYADGTLRRAGATMAGLGLLAAVALTAFGPYPLSMVGVPGEQVSNMSPPTLALLAHATWLIGLVLLLREPGSRWLQRARVWTAVVAANGIAMTAFLWHLTAMFGAVALTVLCGLVQPPVGTAAWWLLRPLWVAVLVLFTTVLVLVFRFADRPRATRTAGARRSGAGPRTAVAAAGMILCVVGILGLSAVGVGGLLAGRTATLVVLPVTPQLSTAILVTGAACLLAAGARVDLGPRAAGRDATQASPHRV